MEIPQAPFAAMSVHEIDEQRHSPRATRSHLDSASDDENADPPAPISDVFTIPLLVALTAAAGGDCPRDNERRAFPIETWQPGQGISSHLSTNDRFRRVLDALAALCVSRPRKQVFAIGVQVHKSNLTLTIADNQPVKKETMKYLSDVWRILKQLSDLYAGKRVQNSRDNSSVEWSTYIGTSPNMPRYKIAGDLTLKLAVMVYDFTIAKNLKRWTKNWDPENGGGLLEFFRAFRARKGMGLDGKDGQFELMVTKLNIALRYLRSAKDTDWAEVLGYMTDATDIADELLEDPYWCEILANEITCKFITIHRSPDHLVRDEY